MKRSFSLILLCALAAATALPVFPQAAREATIEPGTKARIVLQSRLNSKLNEPGDTITAVLEEPIYVNNLMVLPRGTEFHGRVAAVNPAKRGQKSANMTILFDRLGMPWGEEPVSVEFTSIDDWDKGEKLKGDSEGKVKGGHKGDKTVDNVYKGGTIGGAGAGAIILTSRGAGASLPIGGAAIAGGLLAGLLLTKGGEVQLEPGAIFRIQFTKPISLPVVAQGAGSPRPIQQNDRDEKPDPVRKP
jgi:hypothetical protein